MPWQTKAAEICGLLFGYDDGLADMRRCISAGATSSTCVALDCGLGVVDDQVRRDAVVAVGVGFGGHDGFLVCIEVGPASRRSVTGETPVPLA